MPTFRLVDESTGVKSASGQVYPQRTYPPQSYVTQQDGSRFQRLSQIQRGMRSYLNNFRAPSSLYSDSANANISMVNGAPTTPKPSLRRFFGQWGDSSSNGN